MRQIHLTVETASFLCQKHIKGNEIEIIAFVLDIIDHKDYNKKFGYKKS